MDLHLMAAMWSERLEQLGSWAWMIFAVACGLGFVIFVHELGHFVVAKLCGVKCEKFYIGFDVPIKIGPIVLPSRLGRFQWGETEYGIGIIPLGGYVKMLGQDDDPRAAQEEAERIRVRKSKSDETSHETSQEPSHEASQPDTSESPFEPSEHLLIHSINDEYELDPRSLPAKSVPQRMAIISAGVIMNLIFAVIFATLAFRVGVSYTPCLIGGAVPGGPAWRAGLEPGERIIKLGNSETSEHLRFTWDLRNAVLMAGVKDDLPIVVRKPDGEEKSVVLRPVVHFDGGIDIPMIGVAPASTTELSDSTPVIPHMPAGQARPEFQGGDRIVAINGTSIQDGFQLREVLARYVDVPIRVVVERAASGGEKDTVETLEIQVEPARMKRFGLVLGAGPVSGVRPGSPAEQAGFHEGDVIESVNREPLGDPLTLPGRLRRLVGEEVTFQVQRNEGGASQTLELAVVPEMPTDYGNEISPGVPLALDAIGLVMPIQPVVQDVLPGSPAELAGLQAGDRLVAFQFTTKDAEMTTEDLFFEGRETPLNDETNTWPFVMGLLQLAKPGTDLRLVFERQGTQDSVTLTPVASDEYFADRGFRITSFAEKHTATSWTEAASLGLRQTKEDVYRVASFLRKLVTGQISPSKLGGPITIAAVAGSEASHSVPRLLIFLTFLSANLAILNFLPIPALDGGHMVFLLAEWVRGKPVDERLQMALTLAGVVCLLMLMVFVSSMDIWRLLL